MSHQTILMIALGLLVIVNLGSVFWFSRHYKTVERGKAMVVAKMGNVQVTFTGAFVAPVIHKAEIMDVTVKTIEIDRRGQNGLICKDNIRADITVSFFFRVNKTVEDVLKVAERVGCKRASDITVLEELFSAKFSEALKTAAKEFDFEELCRKREEFMERVLMSIGFDLNGYVLEDAAIGYLDQTPIESLDADNILDAQGIKKLTNILVEEHIFINDLRRRGEKAMHPQAAAEPKT